MIVPMKKVRVIVQAKDAPTAIGRLGVLGVLHVEHQEAPKGKDISVLQEDIAFINAAIGILSEPEFCQEIPKAREEANFDWRFIVRHIIDARKRLERLEEYSRHLSARINQWEAWGDFKPEDIAALAGRNVYIRLYRIPVKEINKIPSGVILKKLVTDKGMINCAVISREKVDIPFNEVTLPKISLRKMRARLSEDRRIVESLRTEIIKHACYRQELIGVRKSREKELEFHQALAGMGEAGDIKYLSGYIPFDSAQLVMRAAEIEKWGILIDDPTGEDLVPTLIRNPRWVSIISPVFKLLEVVPGYHELDISLFFLVFFSIFFGMLIGDAGYGMIFLLLTLFSQVKWGNKFPDKALFILFYILSLFAIIWGVLTGTFFGQEWLPQSVKPLIPALRNDKNVQALCFLIGTIHLSLAHSWRAVNKFPSLTALADAGWILILWGGFFLAKLLVLGDAFPAFGKWLFLSGAVLTVLFTSLNRNILKGIGEGLGNLLLNIVNSFTDVVSYIRLFAVGLATVAVADSFNKMAMGIGYNSIITSLVTSFILVVGHGLNVVLGPMSVLVHGVRLNVLEFCSHLDIKWSGFSYRPLREEAGLLLSGDK